VKARHTRGTPNAQTLPQRDGVISERAVVRLESRERSIRQEATMQYVCECPPKTWFRMETEAEAYQESQAMEHAVEKYFRQAREEATAAYVPPAGRVIEQNIGLKDHIRRVMPIFLTLRDNEGSALATAMLPPAGEDERSFRPIVVGPGNTDPYPEHGEAIRALARHYGLTLDPARCYPYRRG
jgi:hypothetical protein